MFDRLFYVIQKLCLICPILFFHILCKSRNTNIESTHAFRHGSIYSRQDGDAGLLVIKKHIFELSADISTAVIS